MSSATVLLRLRYVPPRHHFAAAPAILQLHREPVVLYTPRLLVTWPHRVYLNLVTRHDYLWPGCINFTTPTPRIWTRRLAARLLVGWSHRLSLSARRSVSRLAHPCTMHPGASTRRAARRRLLRLRRASGCLGTSCGSSSTTRRLAARLLLGRSHWLSPCVRSLRLAA
jgi:hypothetical protein